MNVMCALGSAPGLSHIQFFPFENYATCTRHPPPPTRGARNCERVAREISGGGTCCAVIAPHPKCLAADASRHFDPRSSRGQALPALGEVNSLTSKSPCK